MLDFVCVAIIDLSVKKSIIYLRVILDIYLLYYIYKFKHLYRRFKNQFLYFIKFICHFIYTNFKKIDKMIY